MNAMRIDGIALLPSSTTNDDVSQDSENSTNSPAPESNRFATFDTPNEDIVLAGEVHEWLVTADANAELTIQLNTLTPVVEPMVRLIDRNGTILAEDNVNGGATQASLTLTVPQNDNYIVQVSLVSPLHSGRYQLNVTQVTNLLNPGEVLLLPNMPINSFVNDEQLQTTYVFEAKAGNIATIIMQTTDANLDVALTLLAPDGSILGENDDYISGEVAVFLPTDAALVNIILPADGAYRVVAGRSGAIEGTTSGTYEIELQLNQ